MWIDDVIEGVRRRKNATKVRDSFDGGSAQVWDTLVLKWLGASDVLTG